MSRTLDKAAAAAPFYDALAGMNLAVNGFHNVSQEFGATASSAGGFITDNNEVLFNGPVVSGQQVAAPFPSYPGIPNGLKANVTTAKASFATGDYFFIRQKIEGVRLARLGWGAAGAQPLSIGKIVRPSIALTAYVGARNPAQARAFIRRVPLAANTDNFIDLSGALAIPGDTAGVWPQTAVSGMEVFLALGVGTTFQGAADAWQAGTVLAGSDVTNLAAAVNNNVIVSGLVMLPGLSLPPKEAWPLLARHYDEELRLCQRYWQSHYTVLTDNNTFVSLYLPATMRAAPAVTGGGAGFTLNANNGSELAAFQTARAGQTLILNARL